VSGDVGYAVSTLQSAAAGQRLPTLAVTIAFVRACGGDQQAWREYWTSIRRLLDGDVPDTLARSVAPPWSGISPVPVPARGAYRREAVVRATGEPDGWFIESLSVLVRADAEPPEVLERRAIVATVEGIGEIVSSVSVPRHPDHLGQPTGLESELLFGGSLELREQPYDSYFRNVIFPFMCLLGDAN
jgi:hypothetical protein